MENIPEQQTPQVYETIRPDWQIAQLMIKILNNHASELQPINSVTHCYTWNDNRLNTHEKLYWQRNASPFARGIITNLTLSHHLEPGDSTASFLASMTIYSNGRVIPMAFYDSDKKRLDFKPKARQIAQREVLAILSEHEPRLAREVLDTVADTEFKRLIGAYILSERARPGNQTNMDTKIVQQAVNNFSERTNSITQDTLDQAATTTDPTQPQPYYLQAVHEAAETLPRPRGNNRFTPIDYLSATNATANRMGQRWVNVIGDD